MDLLINYQLNGELKATQWRVRGNGIFTDDTLFTLWLLNIYNKLKRNLDAWDLNKYLVEEIYFKKVYIPELKKSTLLERAFYPEKYIFLKMLLVA